MSINTAIYLSEKSMDLLRDEKERKRKCGEKITLVKLAEIAIVEKFKKGEEQ